MSQGRGTSTAEAVAFVRSYATAQGVLDDPFAQAMLGQPWRCIDRLVRRRPFTALGRNRSFAYLIARTLFFDQAVRVALDEGVTQVVVLGAGYDSRAWRLGRPGVRFYEVDRAEAQSEKRRRCPTDGPVFIQADLERGDIASRLAAAGLAAEDDALFLLEGVSMYLPESTVVELLGQLADLGVGHHRLSVNFGVGFANDDSHRARVTTTLGRRLVAAGREPFRFELARADVEPFLRTAGWRVVESLAGDELSRRFLADTAFARFVLNPNASVATAHRV